MAEQLPTWDLMQREAKDLAAWLVVHNPNADELVTDLLKHTEELRSVLADLLGALSLFRPVQPSPDPYDCSSGYPELVRSTWSRAIDILNGGEMRGADSAD